MDANTLNQIIEDAGYETRRYSGRGMYGKECPSLVVEYGRELYAVADIVASVEDTDQRQELADVFTGARTDSMGRDSVVVCFPYVRFGDDA